MTKEEFYKQSTQVDLEVSSAIHKNEIPKQIGGYKIESLLNKGGMSLLYLGIHPDSHEPIAIKVLSSEYVSHPEMVGRFMKEAEIIEITNHPNIVKIYGHGKWEGGLYIAMEFIQGISLRQMILQQAMSLKRALEIVLQISHALAHLHAHGIIHRDLKPENILLTAQGGVKVIDFGISQLFSEKEENIPFRKRIMGTPIYMSPEQKENPFEVSFLTDIYSLAIITYELVLGRLSHGIIHLSMMPKGLQKILAKSLQPKPADRYQDIIDFIKEISIYLSSEEIQKDMRGSDYASELNENLKQSQFLVVPKQIPYWPRVEIAVSSNVSHVVSGIYYDFFEPQENAMTVLMSESNISGVEGLVHMAILKGMVRSLAQTGSKAIELVKGLNHLIAKQQEDHLYTFNYLSLFPSSDLFSYISCGYGPLWHIQVGSDKPRRIESENMSLGLDPSGDILEVSSRWNIGDTLLLHTFQSSKKFLSNQAAKSEETIFYEALMENLFLSPQKQVEAISRKISKTNQMSTTPGVIISIQRIS